MLMPRVVAVLRCSECHVVTAGAASVRAAYATVLRDEYIPKRLLVLHTVVHSAYTLIEAFTVEKHASVHNPKHIVHETNKRDTHSCRI
jgi:hypothetical protein